MRKKPNLFLTASAETIVHTMSSTGILGPRSISDEAISERSFRACPVPGGACKFAGVIVGEANPRSGAVSVDSFCVNSVCGNSSEFLQPALNRLVVQHSVAATPPQA
jgi:hypothetical protein